MTISTKNGFSLVELSMVLTIIAIVAGSLLSIVTTKSEADKIKETEAKMDRLEVAFALYVQQNQKIPCVADGILAQTSASFGVTTRNGTDKYYCNGTTGGWYASGAAPYVDVGTIPTKTLNLPEEDAFDAWGRRITYAMIEVCNTNATEDNIINFAMDDTYCGDPSGSATMTIKDGNGTVLTNKAVMVLVSHGANGHGAFLHNGSATRLNYYNGAAIDADELINSLLASNGTGQTTTGVYIQKPKTLTFDDIVRYKTKIQLIKEAGALRPDISSTSAASSICNIVNIVTGPIPIFSSATTICGTNPGNANCDDYLFALTTQVRSLCF